jgi:uncharacterized membrane protein YhiD involved in acid resistance
VSEAAAMYLAAGIGFASGCGVGAVLMFVKMLHR